MATTRLVYRYQIKQDIVWDTLFLRVLIIPLSRICLWTTHYYHIILSTNKLLLRQSANNIKYIVSFDLSWTMYGICFQGSSLHRWLVCAYVCELIMIISCEGSSSIICSVVLRKAIHHDDFTNTEYSSHGRGVRNQCSTSTLKLFLAFPCNMNTQFWLQKKKKKNCWVYRLSHSTPGSYYKTGTYTVFQMQIKTIINFSSADIAYTLASPSSTD